MLRFFDDQKTKDRDINDTSAEMYASQQNNTDQINYLFVSMQEIPWIKNHLKKFPQYNGKLDKYSNVGVCSTVIFPDIPVSLFGERTFGFVLNDKKINLFEGDIFAANSRGKIYTEILKNEAVNKIRNHYGLTISIKQTSKHPNKVGYMRFGRSLKDNSQGSIFTTNLARKDPQDSSVYHKTGTPDNFAKAIRNIYFEHITDYENKQCNNGSYKTDKYINNDGKMKLNEGIAFQKGNINPIIGIIITEGLRINEAKQLRIIMLENPHLQLFFYKPNAKEHMLRFISNKKGISYLSIMTNFDEVFQIAVPFKGLPITNIMPSPFYVDELGLLKNILVGWTNSHLYTNNIYYNFDDYYIADHYLATLKKNLHQFHPNILNATVVYSENRKYGKYSFYLTQNQYNCLNWIVNQSKFRPNIKNFNKEDEFRSDEHRDKRFKKY